jgi:hypothetical protein
MVQYLDLILLKNYAMNYDKVFYEVASKRVLGKMEKIIDNPHTITSN